MSNVWLEELLKDPSISAKFSSARAEILRENVDLTAMVVEGALRGLELALELDNLPKTMSSDRERIVTIVARAVYGAIAEADGERAMERLLG